MANPAKYLVVMPPGAQVRGMGFLEPGKVFEALSADYVPSRTFRPCNKEAQDALAKVLEPALRKAKGPELEKLKAQLEIVKLPEAKAVQPQLSETELAKLRGTVLKAGEKKPDAGGEKDERKL